MQRLVAVGLGPGNVVVKFVRHRHKLAVHPAECGIAVRYRGHHDAQSPDVIYLLEAQRLAAHLLDNAVNVFGPALHRGGDALRRQVSRQLLAQLFYRRLALGAFFVQQARYLAVGVGLQKAEGQVLHLPLDFPDAQAIGQRRKHLQRLARQAGRHRQLAGGKVAQGLQA